jgi:type II secretory pathway component PulF
MQKINKQRHLTLKGIRVILLVALFISLGVFYFTKNWILSVVILLCLALGAFGAKLLRKKMQHLKDITKMEIAFPEFLELMSSNLRAGMTIDRALLLSSREEFAPLDKEILQLGKDLVTGKEIEHALLDMATRIDSDKMRKTIMLIVTGIRSGGNLATLLQETATNTRERNFIEKRAASNVLMYVIFICFAVAVGAPILFGLSAVLVKTLTGILANIPPVEQSSQLPFTLTAITISPEFVTYFSILFIIISNILGSLILGIVSKGDEKAGVKYILPLVVTSITIFSIVRFALASYFTGFFS